MILLSILCDVEETVESSFGNGIEMLAVLYGAMDVIAIFFLIWLKTPAGKKFLGKD